MSAPAPHRRGAGRWRDLLIGATAVLLLGTAVGHMMFVVPTYRRFLEGAGAVLSAPARLAVDLSHFGLALIALWVAAVAVAYWRERRAPSGLPSVVLAACAFVTAVYLALVTCVYLDAARIMNLVR